MPISTGLYIDKQGIELVQISKTFGAMKVLGATYVPVTYKKDRDAVDRDVMIKSIQQAFQQAGIRPQTVVSALPTDEVMVRYFDMPAVPRKDLSNAVRFEGKKYIPFRLDEVASSHVVLPGAAKSETMQIVFMVAKHESLNAHLQTLQEAGVRASAVEAIPFSLLRIYRLLEKSTKDESALVVHVGSESACVNVMHRQGLHLTRDILLGRVGATHAAGRSVTMEAAARDEGVAAEPLLELLLGEVQLTIDYYHKRFASQNISKLILCGLEECESLIDPLRQELNLPVRYWRLDQELGLKGRSLGALVLATGLALRNFVPRTSWVNLLQQESRTPRKGLALNQEVQRQLTIELAVALGVLALWFVFLYHQRSQVHQELVAVRAIRPSVSLPSGTPMTVAALSGVSGDLGERARLWRNMIEQRIPMTNRVNYLGQALPEGVWLTYLQYGEKSGSGRAGKEQVARTLQLKGLAFLGDSQKEIRAINTFLAGLREQSQLFAGFQRAELVSVNRDSVRGYAVTSFHVQMIGAVGE